MGVTATPSHDVLGRCSLRLLPPNVQSEYLSGAAGDFQHAVDVLLGLVVAAQKPEEEAGIVQGSSAGRLANLLQAALQLLNSLLVCESQREGRG